VKKENSGCYSSEMARERKSPQEKKLREYCDRVTAGNRRNAEARRKEKKSVGRETRSKGDELLAQVKPQLSAEDAEVIAGELTAAHLRKSVNRKRVLDYGAVPFSQVIEMQRERRRVSFGRKTKAHPHYDQRAKEAIDALNSINEKQFVDVARRAGRLCSPEFRDKFSNELKPDVPIDRALHFLCRLSSRSNEENQALCRNKDLDRAFTAWIQKANRILKKDRLAAQRKLEKQQAVKKKLRTPGIA
jgi:hypothetical protein